MALKNIFSVFSGEKGRKILIVGAAAILVLLAVSILPRGEKSAAKTDTRAENTSEIEKTLEKRLEELISRIDGAGEATVMVTLERGTQPLYIKDDKTETNVRNDENGGTAANAHETQTVLAGSSKEPLYAGAVQPKVRGAAVVCGGASDPVIREKVTNAVAKALNIGTSKVYVTN